MEFSQLLMPVASILLNWMFVAVILFIVYKIAKKMIKGWVFEVLKEYEKDQFMRKVMERRGQ